MSKKLLHKTSGTYLIYSILVLIISAPLFYYTTQRLYIQEADDTLMLHKKEFLKYSAAGLADTDIVSWNKFNRNVKIEPAISTNEDSIYTSFYYDTLDAEVEPYRELKTTVLIKGKPHTYVARVNLVESQDLMKSVFILFIVIIAVLLLGLFIITRKQSIWLWKPFYQTLQQIESFEIDKNRSSQFNETGIEEFNRLNASIQKLIEKNTLIYKNQKEFIENAAHELQTPLAVFKVKIDTLIQRPDITKEQSEILGLLNDNISRLNRLNKNLLLLSKIENDNFSNRQTISFTELLQKHLEFFTEQAKAKSLAIQIDLMEELEVRANPVLSEILISNLFLNAIKHNIQNGEIIIHTNNNKLTISNNGQTLPLNRDKLFNRFSKGDPSHQGTGLGLSIVKRIADLNSWIISYNYTNNLHSFSVSF